MEIHDLCIKCSDSSTCTECKNGYLTPGNTCASSCAAGTYISYDETKCVTDCATDNWTTALN